MTTIKVTDVLSTLSWSESGEPEDGDTCPDCGRPFFTEAPAEPCTCPDRYAIRITITVGPGPAARDPP